LSWADPRAESPRCVGLAASRGQDPHQDLETRGGVERVAGRMAVPCLPVSSMWAWRRRGDLRRFCLFLLRSASSIPQGDGQKPGGLEQNYLECVDFRRLSLPQNATVGEPDDHPSSTLGEHLAEYRNGPMAATKVVRSRTLPGLSFQSGGAGRLCELVHGLKFDLQRDGIPQRPGETA